MVAELKVLDNREATCGRPGFSPSGCSPSGRCGNGLEKIYPTCAVRYGYMRHIGEFRYSPGQLFSCGSKVVIQTNRGIELGEQVSLTCTGCDKSVSRKQMLQYVKNSGPEFMQLKSGRILRAATTQDLAEARHLSQDADKKLVDAKRRAGELGLEMKFVTCEHLLGGERIIFYFMAEQRVDFREFVRILAQEYHTRIEMHQVGARDEARLVADYEVCGRECCCKNFLKKLHRVSMRMAKLQKATLDPSKVSGRCGRLRCCLRYEHEGYEELNKKLPRVGTRIRTEMGVGTVRDRQILTQLLSVRFDDRDDAETVAIEEILERDLPARSPSPDPATTADRASTTATKARRGHDQRPSQRNTSHGKQTPSGRKDRESDRRDRSEGGASQPDDQSQKPPAATGDGPASAERPTQKGRRPRRRRRGRRSGQGGRGNERGGASSGSTDQPGG